jgi:hypothetical protein
LQKISFISILLILSTGCSVIRNRETWNNEFKNDISDERILERVEKQNITLNGFYIQKADVKISTKGETKKLLGSIKFEKPDKFLISIKSRSGIEAARVFISDDTVLINNRINRKLYYGSSEYIMRKYGVKTSVLRIMFGDYINDNLSDNGKIKCSGGKLYTDGIISGIRIKYTIDCKKEKIILSETGNNWKESKILIEYGDFLNNGKMLFPGRIEIRDEESMTTIEIRIRKIESPWNGNIDFVPGNSYEKLQLL